MRKKAIVCALTLLALVAVTACGPEDTSPSPQPGTPSPNGSGPLLSKGEKLYVANCQVCHGDRQGSGATGGAPPHNEIGHTWHHPDAQLRDWILNGKFPGAMPAFKDKLSEDQVDAILAYIKTWWTEEQRESQADVSHRYEDALKKQQRSQ